MSDFERNASYVIDFLGWINEWLTARRGRRIESSRETIILLVDSILGAKKTVNKLSIRLRKGVEDCPLIITKADKRNSAVVLDRRDYVEKMQACFRRFRRRTVS